MAKKWGRWTNVRDLGEGGQAHTFVVVDEGDANKTLRVLKRIKSTRPERRERFRQEIEAIQRLHHSNIVELIDHDVDAEEPYLVVEYCAGGAVGDRDPRSIDDSRFRAWIDDIGAGLAFAHASGVIHRDVKPDNVFLRSEDGPAVLGDFGLVFIEGNERVTLDQEQVGSRFYMAPELRDGRARVVTPAADVYSFGKTIYWMLSGGQVLDRENFRDADHNLVTIRRNYALEHVNNVLEKMIAFDPQVRFENATAATAALKSAWRLMDAGYNPLTRADQPCRYCGRGFYQVMSEQSFFSLGLNRGAVNATNYRILKCTVCGNLQAFWKAGAEEGEWIERAGVPHQ